MEKKKQNDKIDQKEEQINKLNKYIKNLEKNLKDEQIKNKNLNKENIELSNKIKDYELKQEFLLKKEKENINIKINNRNNDDFSINFNSKLLIHLEDTYYLNSTLYCLSQTKPLTEYFLKNQNKLFNNVINNNIQNNHNDSLLSYSYYELLKDLFDQKSIEPVNPENFKNTLEKSKTLYENQESRLSKLLVINILDKLHLEMKKHRNRLEKNRSTKNKNL